MLQRCNRQLMEIKKTGILSIKIPLSRACGNQYPDFCCILTVIIPEIMTYALCC